MPFHLQHIHHHHHHHNVKLKIKKKKVESIPIEDKALLALTNVNGNITIGKVDDGKVVIGKN
jgi:hypothetical protein